MGTLYSHKMTDWLKGIPWYFYFVFIFVKLPPLTLLAFLMGLPLAFRRRLGDGRYFLLFWVLFGFVPFALAGGKFTRYFTSSLPLVLIVASIGTQFVARRVAQWCTATALLTKNALMRDYARRGIALLVIFASIWASVISAPHYRLYTNWLGGGEAGAGSYFPHDEFYDASVREAMFEVARGGAGVAHGAHVASETPGLAAFYAQRAGRPDLQCISLSDPAALKELSAGDFIITARGRRYHSNDALLQSLRQSITPAARIKLGRAPSIDIYMLDPSTVGAVGAPPEPSNKRL
jgi:hypothetical protein